MAAVWDAIDPDDITDLFINLGDTEKPFLPVDAAITNLTTTVTAEVTKVTSDFVGKVVRIRVGPAEPGKWPIHYHLELDDGQKRDFDVFVQVKDRVVKAR